MLQETLIRDGHNGISNHTTDDLLMATESHGTHAAKGDQEIELG
jgi:hypothetical protein